MAKDFVIIKGKLVKMNDAAFRIASKHFGATKEWPAQRSVPIELLKMPKLPIIPATKVEIANLPRAETKVEPVKVEIPRVETPVVKTPVVETPVVKTPTTEMTVLKKKSTAKKRKR